MQIRLLDEGCSERPDVGPNILLHPLYKCGQVGRCALGRDQLRLQVLDPRRPLLQLHDQLRDVVRDGHSLGEPLLLGPDAAQLAAVLFGLGLATYAVGTALDIVRAPSVVREKNAQRHAPMVTPSVLQTPSGGTAYGLGIGGNF